MRLRGVENIIKTETYGGETGDIDDGQRSGNARRGLVEVAQPLEPLVGNHDTCFLKMHPQ